MEFECETREAEFRSPLEDFEEVTEEIEFRRDPLTGRRSRIVSNNFRIEESDVEGFVDSDECIFCRSMLDESTPEYPGWMDAGRDTVGEAVSFPNLFPYAPYSNLVVLTEDHYRPIDGFGAEELRDGLDAALRYVNDVFEKRGDAVYVSVNMNYLRAAGSSIVHPHLQTVLDDVGTNVHRAQLEASVEYREETGFSYWEDLLDEEGDGARYVGSTGDVEWIAAFAPLHHRHLQGIAPGPGIPQPGGGASRDLAEGLTRVLDYYASLGLNSFNLALYLSDRPGWRPVVNVVARSVFGKYYWSDAPFFTVLHYEGVVDVAPEEYASEAADHF